MRLRQQHRCMGAARRRNAGRRLGRPARCAPARHGRQQQARHQGSAQAAAGGMGLGLAPGLAPPPGQHIQDCWGGSVHLRASSPRAGGQLCAGVGGAAAAHQRRAAGACRTGDAGGLWLRHGQPAAAVGSSAARLPVCRCATARAKGRLQPRPAPLPSPLALVLPAHMDSMTAAEQHMTANVSMHDGTCQQSPL